MDHLGNAFHHLAAGDHAGARLHQVGDGAAVAGAFDHEVGDQRDGLRVVQFDAAGEALAGDLCGHGDQQLVFLAFGEAHGRGLSSEGPETGHHGRAAEGGAEAGDETGDALAEREGVGRQEAGHQQAVESRGGGAGGVRRARQQGAGLG